MPIPRPKQYGPSIQRTEFLKNMNIDKEIE